MGVIGDVYEVTDEAEQQGQQLLNVYFYRQTGLLVGNAAEQLANAWIDQILPSVLDVQCTDVTHKSVTVKNLFNDTEAHTELISEPGQSTDDVMPVFNAVGYRLIGDNSAVRDGAKRFPGVPEQQVNDGVITGSGYIALLVALGVALVSGVDIGLVTNAMLPVVVKRILEDGDYRLPNSQGESVLSTVIDSLFNVDVTSQTSRKIGRGA